ncbi:von Willebrand factor type A domain-containing protein [Xylaria sp. FL1777]|nr:von Willebrand factor type A domain-containing protein [Xylaria sp. FL1777]
MSIFSAGIVWDPREPLPHEYTVTASPSAALSLTGGQAAPITQRFFRPQYSTQENVHTKIFPSNALKELNRNVLPAVSVSIEARIAGDVAEVTAKQLFWNDADVPIRHGSYTFALPNNCTVTGFTCRIGNNKVLKATARPKVEAQMEFEQALGSQNTAALLEQNTAEIFTSSLGNIPPNTRVKTEITYATILQRRFGQDTNTTTLVIPTYIVNRYGRRPDSLQGINIETKPDDISLRIEILESEHIKSIRSVSHEIHVERGTESRQARKWDHIGKGSEEANHETAIVTMKEATSWMETDFMLSIDAACSKGDGSPEAWLEIHPLFESQAAMMVTLPPRMLPILKETSKTGEILFVADRSGSMEDKIGNLRSAMQFFLKGIPIGRTFNIWSFGSHYERLWAKSRVYEEESLRIALNYVDTNFRPDMGGTEILPALEAIIAARDPSLPCDVVILTDGEVWRLDDTLNLIRRARESSNGAIRFFSLGLGAHVSHALVEGIAKQGGGYSEIIPRADKDGWEERVVAILKAALTSHVHDLRLELGGLKGMTSPANLQCLNPFQAHRIFLLLEQGTAPENDIIPIVFTSEGKRTTMNATITRPEKPSTLIHSLSARALLDDLERGISSTTAYQGEACLPTEGEAAALSRLAESIACRYALPSKWTSLFLLEKDDEVLEEEAQSGTAYKITISNIEDETLQKHRGRHLLTRIVPSEPSCFSDFNSHLLPDTITSSSQTLWRDRSTVHAHERVRIRSPAHDSLSRVIEAAPHSPLRSHKKDVNFCAEKVFISSILRCQAFDGSIGSEALNELPEVARDIISTLRNWLCKRTTLEDPVLNLVVITALVLEILERDYKDYKDLWIMMREKSLGYINLQIQLSNIKDGLLEYSRETLKTLDSVGQKRKATSYTPNPVRGLRKLVRSLYAGVSRKKTPLLDSVTSVRQEDEYVTDSSPVLVKEAPTDD